MFPSFIFLFLKKYILSIMYRQSYWFLPEKADNKIVVPMTQQEAKAKFLERFYDLFGQGEK